MIEIMLVLIVLALIIGGLITWGAPLFAILATVLVIGTTPFWILLFLYSCVLCWTLDHEDDDFGFGISTILLIAILLSFEFFSENKPFTYLWDHPWIAIEIFLGYFVIGAIWSIVKWWFSETNRFQLTKERFIEHHSIKGTNIPPEYMDRWDVYMTHAKTDPSRHKTRFLSWITYWPWSLIWTMINDPLKRLVKRIYQELLGTYQKITDRVWKIT